MKRVLRIADVRFSSLKLAFDSNFTERGIAYNIHIKDKGCRVYYFMERAVAVYPKAFMLFTLRCIKFSRCD